MNQPNVPMIERWCDKCNKFHCDDCHGHHHECFEPEHDVECIVRCAKSLRCTVAEVLKCLHEHPSTKHLFPIFTCILLQEIEEIERILCNRRFGLREIKNEIKLVENEVLLINNSVNSPIFGLNEIKNEVRFVENEVILINNSVNSPIFGLNEIKNEVRFVENQVILINNSVNNSVFGLNEIKNEVRFVENQVILINNTVNNPVIGLNEIKNEVRFVENQVILINNTVNNPVLGLNEIKNEIRFIENQIILINNAVNNPVFGLNEIKNEIRQIENQVFNVPSFCPNVTSGSIFTGRPESQQVAVAVKNRNTTPQTVRVRVLNDDTCPASVLANQLLQVAGCCKNEIITPINTAAEYEIEVFGLVPGMSVSAIELNAGGNPVRDTRLTNTQFFCLTGNCPVA